jgi:hypothetical protein
VARYTLGWLGAIAVVVGVAIAIVIALARGGGQSDEHAVRAWFESTAGGSAPISAVSAIHVGACDFADATFGSRDVVKCTLTTDAPNPTLHSCFVFAGDNVVAGGWQLKALDACDGIRFDAQAHDLLDTLSDTHYHLTAPA